MRATTQRGSVLSFVIVAVLLVLAAAGVIYLARTYGDTTADKEIAVPAEQKQASSKESDEKEAEKPTQTPPPEEDEAKDDKPQQSGSENETREQTSESSDQSATVDQYSQTGPADTAAQLLAVGLMTSSVVAYNASRRRSSL